jgi:hypothetical protein
LTIISDVLVVVEPVEIGTGISIGVDAVVVGIDTNL